MGINNEYEGIQGIEAIWAENTSGYNLLDQDLSRNLGSEKTLVEKLKEN